MGNPSSWTSWSDIWRRKGLRTGCTRMRSSGSPGKNLRKSLCGIRPRDFFTGKTPAQCSPLFFSNILIFNFIFKSQGFPLFFIIYLRCIVSLGVELRARQQGSWCGPRCTSFAMRTTRKLAWLSWTPRWILMTRSSLGTYLKDEVVILKEKLTPAFFCKSFTSKMPSLYVFSGIGLWDNSSLGQCDLWTMYPLDDVTCVPEWCVPTWTASSRCIIMTATCFAHSTMTYRPHQVHPPPASTVWT